MTKLRVILAATLCFAFGVAASGDVQDSADEKKITAEASAAYEAKNWTKSAALYEKLTQAHPETPRLWFRLGTSLQELGQLDRALDVYQKALKAGTPALYAEYSIATIYAQKKEIEHAFEHLEKAVKAGYNQPKTISSDPLLADLRSDKRFANLVEQTERNLKPCAYTPENRQFDFWVGEWAVETTNGGVPAGVSKIDSVLYDCVILESWHSNGNPYSGT